MSDRDAALMELYEATTAVREYHELDPQDITILTLTVACQLWAEAEQDHENPTPFQTVAESVYDRWERTATPFTE